MALWQLGLGRIRGVVVACSLMLALPAWAQEPSPEPPTSQSATEPAGPPASQPVQEVSGEEVPAEKIIITATRTPTPADQIGSSVSVISAQQLQDTQQPFVADQLRQTPSVDIVRSGGPSQSTSVFTRGTDSDHTLVLIDGIVANDPSSPAGAFDFSDLTCQDVDHIEVLRGPQSVLYGSNAIGGVVNVITKRGSGPPSGYLLAETGSYSTQRQAGGVSGGDAFANYSLNFANAHSVGFPAADKNDGNTIDDGYRNLDLAGKFGVNISKELDIDFVFRTVDNKTDTAAHGGPGGDSNYLNLETHADYFRVAPHLVLCGGAWEQTFAVNDTQYVSRYNDVDYPDLNEGGIIQLDWQHDLHLCKCDTVVAGVDWQEENFEARAIGPTPAMPNTFADTTSLYLEDQLSLWKRLFLTGGTRYEQYNFADHQTDYTTYRFTAAYLIPETHTKLHGSVGTGFKEPSLYQLFSEFGSTSLRPEESQGEDIGVQESLLKGDRLVLDATYFHNHVLNLIDYNYVTNKDENIDAARMHGVELSANWRLTNDWSVSLADTHTDTQDMSTGLTLLRRPHDQFAANTDYRFCNGKADANLSLIYNSSRADIDPITYDRATLAPYVVLNFAASYQLTPHVMLFGRIDNLLNTQYEEVDGYGTEGLSFYGGVKVTF